MKVAYKAVANNNNNVTRNNKTSGPNFLISLLKLVMPSIEVDVQDNYCPSGQTRQ